MQRGSDKSSSDPCGMARLAKALAAISRGSAIAAEGRGASGTVSVAASVHSALREQRVQLCVFLEPLVLGYSFSALRAPSWVPQRKESCRRTAFKWAWVFSSLEVNRYRRTFMRNYYVRIGHLT